MTKQQAKKLLQEVRDSVNAKREPENRLGLYAGTIVALASARIVLDAAGVTDKATRSLAAKALLDAGHGFGSNASQLGQWCDSPDKSGASADVDLDI